TGPRDPDAEGRSPLVDLMEGVGLVQSKCARLRVRGAGREATFEQASVLGCGEPRTRALLSVRKKHNGKRSRIHDGECGGLSRSGTRSERRSLIHAGELARGQPGRQLAGSLSPK